MLFRSIRKYWLMLTCRSLQKRRWPMLIKLIPCFLLVTYVVHKMTPNTINTTTIGEEKSSSDYDYQHDQTFLNSPQVNSLSPKALRTLINSTNKHEIIFNIDKYDSIGSDDPVIVIQVHDRVEYLRALINSLESVEGIDQSLIIFTHDVYNPTINTIIQSINFCKVIQLFYPFSIQAYPNEFPGTDPKDCPRDINQQKAMAMKCQNSEHPDTYGHYREAVYTQTKHHWFWKMNTIFDKLNATKNHNGPFIFLEEDHYVSPDLLFMLKSMIAYKIKNNLDVNLYTLGAYVKIFNYASNGNKLDINRWVSSQHNMGFVLLRDVWNQIRSCSKHFCTYDDYNWDWSLQHISEKCLTKPLMTLSVIAPRVFHVGECGVHHKKVDCSKNKLISKVQQTLKAAIKYLFPSQLILAKSNRKNFKMPKVNGGWADIRDQILCLQQVVHPEKMEPFK